MDLSARAVVGWWVDFLAAVVSVHMRVPLRLARTLLLKILGDLMVESSLGVFETKQEKTIPASRRTDGVTSFVYSHNR